MAGRKEESGSSPLDEVGAKAGTGEPSAAAGREGGSLQGVGTAPWKLLRAIDRAEAALAAPLHHH